MKQGGEETGLVGEQGLRRAQAGAAQASLVAQMVKNLPAVQESQVRSLGQEYPLEKGKATHLQYTCLENSMSRGAWWATAHGVAESQTRLRDTHT